MLARMVLISWPRDMPVSASQSAGITGMTQNAQNVATFIKLNKNYFLWFLFFSNIMVLSSEVSITFREKLVVVNLGLIVPVL